MFASTRRQTAPFRTLAAACLTLLTPACLTVLAAPAVLAEESSHVRVEFGQHSAWGQMARDPNAPLPGGPARINYSGAPQTTAYAPEQHLRLKSSEFGGR